MLPTKRIYRMTRCNRFGGQLGWPERLSLRAFALGLMLPLLCGGAGSSEISSAAQPMLAIDMEGETSIEHVRTGETERVVLLQDDRRISTTWDVGTRFSVYRTQVSYRGDYALGFLMEREQRAAGQSEKSKFEINVARHDEDKLNRRFGGNYVLDEGRERFLGFAFRMDDSYEQPVRWLLHMQVWQCCSLSTQPPLVFQVLPNASSDNETIKFIVLKRTDAHLHNPPRSDNGERLTFVDGSDVLELKKGRWYRLVFGLKPKAQADERSDTGSLSLSVDGRMVLRHRGLWGYTTLSGEGIANTYAVKIGAYRAAQNTAQKFEIDAIRWATTFEAADPDQP
jgi:hypothetical protein